MTPRSAYRWLVRRGLPPGAAWALWRVAGGLARLRRRGVEGPNVAVAHLALGASGRDIEGLVARGPGASDPSRLLVITDSDAVHLAAASGCRLEYLPPREDWRKRFPGGDYDAFLSRRMDSILTSYRIAELTAAGEVPEAIEGALARSAR